MEVRFSKQFWSDKKRCYKPILIHIYGVQCDLLKTLKLSNSLILLFILDSRAQKSPKITQKLSRRITFYSIFLIGMAYIWWDLVIPFVQRVQNMYGKGGGGSLRPIQSQPKLTSISRGGKLSLAVLKKISRPQCKCQSKIFLGAFFKIYIKFFSLLRSQFGCH